MSAEPTNVEKLRGLPWSIAANAANTVFVQFTFFGSVFVLFLGELQLDKAQIGSLLSLFPFTGLVALLVAPTVARYGYKRIYLTFFGARKLVTAFLLLTPLVYAAAGSRASLFYVATVVIVFAILRAVAETANYPWVQEYVPNGVRGKFSATNNVFTTLVGLLAVTVAGLFIDRTGTLTAWLGGLGLGALVGSQPQLTGYMLLIFIGVVFGLLSVATAARIPGGAPRPSSQGTAPRRDLMDALRDRNFILYLVGVSLITLGTTPVSSFLPLFMQEQVGLAKGNIVLLQTGTLLGGLLSGYLWGWAADRYGSKPVMLSGILLLLLLPISWLLMPRQSELSLVTALSIAVFQGFANMGWGIGSARLLFVSVVPAAKKMDYMALYQAWIGVIGGVSQLVGGLVLSLAQSLQGQFLFLPLDAYFPLFLLGLALPAASMLLLRAVQVEGDVGIGQFAGMFLRGNPFLAMSSMIGYYLARDEQATVSMTERLAQTRSPLAVDELLQARADPRFNVRYEAVVAMAHTRPDSRLTHALVETLEGSELALSVVAAWALGRIADPVAAEPLRRGLDSPYRSIQVHSARALGALGDRSVIPLLLERLDRETDKGLSMAYAAALGQLQATEATERILKLLRTTENEGARLELALALTRIVGEEHDFIQLLRHSRTEVSTATSQAVTTLKRRFDRELRQAQTLSQLLGRCATALARNELAEGVSLLVQALLHLPMGQMEPHRRAILTESSRCLAAYGPERIEYLLLTLYILSQG